ncbi:MAG TPA: MFS transporter [Gammaproteobacteria bacterium]|nr:MFS transporter [Gammaproteobacteria bacterium]
MCREIPEIACREQPRNFLIHIGSLVASRSGDQLSSPKLVLSWLLVHLGAPVFMLGLLVPIRESLSLLPQLFVARYIRRVGVRKWFWVAGSLVEGAAVITMALVAVTLQGAIAGWCILALLTIFSLARGVCSIAAKDVLGKTVSKTRRGMVSGYASSLAGAITIVVGVVWLFVAPHEQGVPFLAGLLVIAGTFWLLAAFLYGQLAEYSGATEGGGNAFYEAIRQMGLIRKDAHLRQFLVVRMLLLSTALVAPFYIALINRQSGVGLAELGVLLIVTGTAGFLSAPVWGRLSDRSSRKTMAIAALLAALAGFTTVVLARMGAFPGLSIWLAATWFLLTIAHAGVRVGRKTHLIDIATTQNRASYVAVSNTVIGVMLLVGGAISGLAALLGPDAAILALSILSLLAAVAASRLKEAQ